VIPAGGSGQLTAKVVTKSGTSSKLAKNISVQTDAPGAENLRLTVTFTVVTPILVTPAQRLYINTLEGTPVTDRVLMHRVDGKPLEAEIESTTLPDRLKVEVVPASAETADPRLPAAQPGDEWLVVTADAVAEAFDHNGSIVLATNDPAASQLIVPLIVRVRPMIDVRPNPVRLWLPDGGPDGTSALVRLGHGGRLKFEITGIEVADPKLVTVEAVSEGAQQIHSLRVSLADGITVGEEPLRTSVRIATSDRARPVIELPVEVYAHSQTMRRNVRPTQPTTAASAPGAADVH
jgi:hypothetical protein